MSTSLEICFVQKSGSNPYESIRYVGGRNPDGSEWMLSAIAAINAIHSGRQKFHVPQGARNLRVIVGRTLWGYEYLRTEADGDLPTVLLGLPERASQGV